MIGMAMPDIDVWSERVTIALGQNPGLFTGPGTNTYLVGTGRRRILLDTGSGVAAYPDVLAGALQRAGCDGIQEIVLTHGHPDHLGGVAQVRERFGALRASKLPNPDGDPDGFVFDPLADGAVVRTEGCTQSSRPATRATISASCSKKRTRSSPATTCSASAPR